MNDQDRLRDKLDRDREAFLAKGGVVTRVPIRIGDPPGRKRGLRSRTPKVKG